MVADRVASAETMMKINNEFIDVFIGFGNFKGTFYFYLLVKDNAKPYFMLPSHVADAPKEPFKK